MGLSGSRKRAKYSHDPNNTAWTRSSSSFGQKVLLSQGWTPGSVLGASNASYTDNPASLSHVRITMRDDNLGVGARNGPHDDDPTTGLDGLQNLLGRLNGRDNKVLQSEQRSREDTRKAIYADRRWGFNNFVSGGFLVGDRIQLQEAKPPEVVDPPASVNKPPMVARSREKASGPKQKKKDRTRKSGNTDNASVPYPAMLPSPDPSSKVSEDVNNEAEAKKSKTVENSISEAQRHAEKVKQKARWRARKAAKVLEQQGQNPPDMARQVVEAQVLAVAATPRVMETKGTHGRHAVRRRFILHKKMSLTDQKALNEILMIRA
ncbi:MAG: hypothetical protein Q9181_001640 [Wetmoreana brouardii]